MSWRLLDTPSLEIEYAPSSCTGGDYSAFIADYRSRSEQAYATLKCLRNVSYGPSPDDLLDFFPASHADVPLVVFIHGGYWQELSKNESSFSASDFVEQGVAFCAIDYTLSPHAGIGDMVCQCASAIEWLYTHHEKLGFDRNRIVVAGSSAGAHLAAMTTLQLQRGTHTKGLVKGVVLISGVFELEPLLQTSENRVLGLTRRSAIDLSPICFQLSEFPSTVVAWGGIETSQFKWQSQRFADALRDQQRMVTCIEESHRNHFDIVFDLGDPRTRLGSAVILLADSTRES